MYFPSRSTILPSVCPPNFKFLCLVNNSHVYLCVKSSNGAWKSYERSHPRKLMTLFLPETTNQK